MKITSLVENTADCEGIVSEHGLSIYIETSKHKILFDMGQSDAFVRNADCLGVDLTEVDIAVLSHGHYDHGGGLKHFLKINDHAPIYLSVHAFDQHYGGAGRYIGLDCTIRENSRLIKVEEKIEIDDELSLFTCNERQCSHRTNCFGQKVKRGEEYVPDPFLHEQYLLVRSEGNLVLFSGCSHKGILNIVDWFSPDVLVGGFHFSRINPRGEEKIELEKAAQKLMEYPTKYFTGHCTGLEQYKKMKECMGERLNYLSAGMSVEI